jgi:chromate reductase, NAD(P)H dehydrogenase (quinone)
MEESIPELHIVGICGSLRKNSFNRGLIRAFGQLLPEKMKFTIADISDLPFFTEDREQNLPETVMKLKELVESADALIVSTPEYNLSYSAVLKNALEWLSRSSLQRPIAGKIVAVMGAASIQVGVSQSHLRDVLYGLNAKLINRPIIHVGNASVKFDEKGNLIDSGVKKQLETLKDELMNVLK